ncbi:hypothetical protein ACFVYR_31985 [Streptomyces sp. NPDC058284]|uniref:hypothetical protein n=1 Tax=unclassified Streptomyces TaxID=2593676 RepID=UPI00366A1509
MNMSNAQPVVTGVQAEYAARVAAHLDANQKEQQRLKTELAALQEQLQALESDHTVLLNVQKALGTSEASAGAGENDPVRKKKVPAPRGGARKSGVVQATSAAAIGNKDQAAKDAKNVPKARKKSAQPASGPTLVELISNHLGQQSEPRSAAEITAALAQANPGRNIKAAVVRTTAENLVAKGRAERTKQGSAVFYTTASPAESAAVQHSEAPSS